MKLKLISISLLVFATFFTFFQSENSVFSEEGMARDAEINSSGEKIEDELAWLKEENYVSIAAKSRQKVSKAPSIVTVITAKEIENMGFRTLSDVLVKVPGFDIIKDGAFGRIDYVARGMRSVFSSYNKIKVHIDGHSLNMPYSGGANYFFDDIPVQNVKKIEIIRGPGSALYGENAFLAVVNIITKDASDIDGVDVTSGFGSYDTQEYNVNIGKNLYGVDVTGFTNFYSTNGLSETIKEDAFSGKPLINQFSIAPGDTDDGRKRFDSYFKLSYKDLQLLGKYTNKDTEPFVGSNFVLTDDGTNKFNFVMGELNYKFDIGDRLTVKPRVYYDQYDIEFFAEPFPDGFILPDADMDGDIEKFPDGVHGTGFTTNRRWGFENQMDYEISNNNTFTLGFDYKWERQDNVEINSNSDPLTNASLGSDQNVSDIGNWIRRVYRQIWAIYIQDKWAITNDLEFTAGIRHDHYSDFEGTTNPRIAIVWDFYENATLKLLYGQAFRAPAFNELYLINQPVLQGNSDLKPETIRTYEVGLGYKFNESFSVNTNYFFNVIRDNIVSMSQSSPREADLFTNAGGSNVQGIEFETRADLDDYWRDASVFANYTYQDAESKGDPIPDSPKHKGNVGVNLGVTKYINANLNAFISGPRSREEADGRDDSPGYTIVNFTLIAKEFFKGMKAKASMFNLLDKKYDDPASLNTVSTDLPRPGRTFFIELGYEF